MPFNPNLPQPHDDLDAVVVNNQLNALKSLIDAVPVMSDCERFSVLFDDAEAGFFGVNDAGGRVFTRIPRFEMRVPS